MATRQIRIWPDAALSEVATPVEVFDEDIRTLVSDLFDTMYEANGVGLAANQVGVTQRVLVIDLDPSGRAEEDIETQEELVAWGFSKPIALINPHIVHAEGHIVWEEGCLSVPGFTDNVKRKEFVRVRAFDVDGNVFEIEARGLFAVAIQHEIDHLDGKVFVDYLSKLKRDVVRRKMVRLKDTSGNDGVTAAAQL